MVVYLVFHYWVKYYDWCKKFIFIFIKQLIIVNNIYAADSMNAKSGLFGIGSKINT